MSDHGYYVERKRVEKPEGMGAKKPTIKQRIALLLEGPGSYEFMGARWWTVAEVQRNVYGSSVRSRMQDLMSEIGEDGRRADETYYEFVEIHGHGGAPFKIYRKRPAKREQQFTLNLGGGR